MNINELLCEAGRAIGYPAAQDIYEADSDRSITFTYEDERTILFADNEEREVTIFLMVSMNTPQDYNYLEDKKRLKRELKARGFRVESVQTWLENTTKGVKRTRRTVFTVNITGAVEE